MISRTARRIAATTLIATTSAALGVFATPTAAHAGTITVEYACETPTNGTQTGPVTLTTSAPTTGTVGQLIAITVETSETPVVAPVNLDAGSVRPTALATVSGAQTDEIFFSGPANPNPIPAGQKVKLEPMVGLLELKAPGEVHITPGNATAIARVLFLDLTITCTPTSPPGIGHTITVS